MDGEEARGTDKGTDSKGCEGVFGIALHRHGDASHAARCRLGSICAQPPALGDPPPGRRPARGWPVRPASAPRRMRCVQRVQRPAAPRGAALPTESCDSDVPGVAHADRDLGQGLEPDPDQVTRMTRTRTGRSPCWPRPGPESRPDPVRVAGGDQCQTGSRSDPCVERTGTAHRRTNAADRSDRTRIPPPCRGRVGPRTRTNSDPDVQWAWARWHQRERWGLSRRRAAMGRDPIGR